MYTFHITYEWMQILTFLRPGICPQMETILLFHTHASAHTQIHTQTSEVITQKKTTKAHEWILVKHFI